MTDPTNPPDTTSDEPAASRGGNKLLVAAVTALLLALGLSVLVALWWRRGGPRTVITELAEEGAVRLADTVLDEVLGAA
jgi:hypothetical protein